MTPKIESSTSLETADLIRNFLNGHYSGVLATADKAGTPHAAVVYFSLRDDFSIVFSTKRETQKYKNIEANKQVAFVVYNEKEQTTVQITGHAEVIEDEDERQKAINNMFSSSAERSQTEIPPGEKILGGDFIALRLVPMVIKMAIYARPDSEGDDLYETLLFSE